MRWTQSFIPTLKEAPADAEVISHQLLIRAGMIRKVAAGIYNYLPLGLKAIAKVANIIREEMNRSGSQELLLPAVQPGDLWMESGRWEEYGKELLRFKDRHERDYCLGPTHEEVITDMIRKELRSYRQLPISLYQIQTKFRDEIRPRFGLMRGREFIMKDAYTFDKDDAGADTSYWTMYHAYMRIFNRLGMRYKPVEADSGSIGGSFSHEFMVLAQTGEDTIITCTQCDYAANQERAVAASKETGPFLSPEPFSEIATPMQQSIDDLCAFLNIPPQRIIKTMLLDVDGAPVAVLLRADRNLNEVKVKNLLNATHLSLATPEQVEAWTNAPAGFAGPIQLDVKTILADLELKAPASWIVGANKQDTHLQNVNLERDARISAYADLRLVAVGDPCALCQAPLQALRGIEVGHVFKLGIKYSQALHAFFLDEHGKERPVIMGCYGIGVTRVVAACIEQNHDAKGIVFPPAIAPVEIILICLDPDSDPLAAKAEEIYQTLNALGLDVLFDDRRERPGVKFNDADLIGAPMQLTLGAKGLNKGILEAKNRKTGKTSELPLENFLNAFNTWQLEVYASWNL